MTTRILHTAEKKSAFKRVRRAHRQRVVAFEVEAGAVQLDPLEWTHRIERGEHDRRVAVGILEHGRARCRRARDVGAAQPRRLAPHRWVLLCI